MRLLMMCLPVLIMFGGAFWLATMVRQTPHEQRGSLGKRLFMHMSYGVGLGFILWASIVMFLQLFHVAVPLIFMGLGVVMIFQGWIFNRIYK